MLTRDLTPRAVAELVAGFVHLTRQAQAKAAPGRGWPAPARARTGEDPVRVFSFLLADTA